MFPQLHAFSLWNRNCISFVNLQVEKLEEERIQLKQILRKQAIDRGERYNKFINSCKHLQRSGTMEDFD